jgi:dipeptidyl aminopeptidase
LTLLSIAFISFFDSKTIAQEGPVLGKEGPVLGKEGPVLGKERPVLGKERPVLDKEIASFTSVERMISFGQSSTTFTWITAPTFPDGSHVELTDGEFLVKHVQDKNSTVLAHQDDFVFQGKTLSFSTWSLSPDMSLILLATNVEGGWRHGSFADYFYFDVKAKTLFPLNQSKSDKVIPHEKGSGKISFASFAPTGHHVAWVRDNDLYMTIDGAELRVTTDGSKNIINGISDWVYEEEVLAEQKALWISPDGSAIAFAKFNDTYVKNYELQYYEKYGEDSYPTMIDVKYPKPGSPNPEAFLYIAKISADKKSTISTKIDFGSADFPGNDGIITEVTWVSTTQVLLRLMNRVQDHQKLFLISQKEDTWIAKLIRDEPSPDGAWYNSLNPLYFVKPSSVMNRTSPSYIELTDIGGYAHLSYFASVDASKPTRWITEGKWEVTQIKGFEPDTGMIYYSSTEFGPMQRHLYSIMMDGTNKVLMSKGDTIRQPLLVPQLKESLGLASSAGYYDAEFSPGCRYYILGYKGPDVPNKVLKKTRNGTSLSSHVR